MQRWKISVLLGICITVLLISCVAILLQDDDDGLELLKGDGIDPPLHPISSPSYTNSSKKILNEPQSHQRHHPQNDDTQHDHNEHDEQEPTYLQNYRKRFSDVVKGVFKDLINSKNATSISEGKESTENNSSRLKRQLDFGSASDEDDNGRTGKPVSHSTPSSSSRRPAVKFTTKKPIIRILNVGGSRDESSSASSAADSDENKIESSSSVENLPGGYRKKSGSRRSRPNFRQLSPPSNERYDVTPEDNPKNFTYEVVQVERKVVRKEDGHVPTYFTKGQKFNIEPRLAKVEKKEAQNRPAVLYRKNWSPEQKSRGASHRRGQPSMERSTESSSGEDRNRSGDSQEKKVIVNLDQQLPYNDRDLSEEDLKDYHDGHSTFGSKGNFTHTIISRNVGGFVPNNAENSPTVGGDDSLRKRSGGATDRKFVIEKGKVTERYPSRENLFDSPEEIEIYTVPGGRSSSTERYNRKKSKSPVDLTSPEVPTSFEDLYQKGHPGVVRAPQNNKNREIDSRRDTLTGPYGDSAEFGSPFQYNPLVDEPPLKFDPASDRFYGNPTPDTREKLALSNSPVKVENNPSRERGLTQEDYFKPSKRSRSAEDEAPAGGEDDTNSPASAEVPVRNQPDDRFDYGRPYNPPDYSTDYDTGAEGNLERGDTDNEPNYDFVGLDENFAPERQSNDRDRDDGLPDDFFDFPGDPNERGLGGFRPRADSNRDSEERRGGNDYDEGTTERDDPDRKPPPPPPAEEQPTRGASPDYENNSRENDYGGFGSSSGDGSGNRGDVADDAPGDIYDSGFIQTLKQFDEEIKKLQDEERRKLLQSSPLPPESIQQRPETPVSSTTSGYKKGTPLIITSPGPLEHSQGVGSTIGVIGDDFAGPPPPPPPPSDSSENHSGEDTTVANSSAAEDEEEEEEDEQSDTNRNVGAPEHSTERSGEEEDEEKKRK